MPPPPTLTSPRPLDGSAHSLTKPTVDTALANQSSPHIPLPAHCINPAAQVNGQMDTQVEVRVYPCNNNNGGHPPRKKSTQFHVKPEGVIIQGTNKHRAAAADLGAEYAAHVGRKLPRYELSDTRACQLLVTTHARSFWVVPAPEAFSRHSGTCRLLGDRKHAPAPHTLQVGDFLRVGSVGVVVIETHDGRENRILSEEKIQKIMKDTTSSAAGFLDLAETDGENSDESSIEEGILPNNASCPGAQCAVPDDVPTCYMCFDEEDTPPNPLISPCKCLGSTRYVHLNCLRKWHTADADNQICFLSSVDVTCSVCKTTFKSDVKLRDGRTVKLFKSTLEPPYVSLLVATKHEMAQRLFNTRFQLSFSTLLKPDGRNGTRPLLLGRSSGSDMVLDYRTVSARHATIRFKNGQFLFTDAGSSNGSYLYLRRPVELVSGQSVQFRLGRSIISMKVVNKWNKRLLKAMTRRAGLGSSGAASSGTDGADDHSVGSADDDVRVTDATGEVVRNVPRRTRDQIMDSMPPIGTLSQTSARHLDLLYALAYPAKNAGAVRGSEYRKAAARPAAAPLAEIGAPAAGPAGDDEDHGAGVSEGVSPDNDAARDVRAASEGAAADDVAAAMSAMKVLAVEDADEGNEDEEREAPAQADQGPDGSDGGEPARDGSEGGAPRADRPRVDAGEF
mmetsp:Transcript_22689/g.52109  ORF Transcript_22689/g.52109 Transcript_22689/m.52109 type:complete len:676 (-) Transcript_22689:289-2316(-)